MAYSQLKREGPRLARKIIGAYRGVRYHNDGTLWPAPEGAQTSPRDNLGREDETCGAGMSLEESAQKSGNPPIRKARSCAESLLHTLYHHLAVLQSRTGSMRAPRTATEISLPENLRRIMMERAKVT